MSSQSRSEDGENWSDIREQVLDRDGYECRFCGISDEEHNEENHAGLDVHHVIPQDDGGEDSMSNLVALCRSCHRTLESIHGQAIADIVRKEDHTEDLRGLDSTFSKYRERSHNIDEELAEFINENPVFRKRFHLYDESSTADTPAIHSHELYQMISESEDTPISSEWEFAVLWGYKEGVNDVTGALDGRTGVPFEGIEDG